ncbi:thioredoxin family protein [candidate division WOR-3 bacterium]|nr:thioredoxin family protein [candidate division WOR-3 bacterium]
MQRITVVFVLALLVVAGCGSKTTTAPTAPPQASTEETGAVAANPGQPKAEEAAKPVATNLPKLWDFWTTWCPPCKQLKPTIEALEKEYEGKIEIRSIDSDENQDLARKFNVQAIPTLVFLDAKGNELSRIVGLVPRDTIVGRFKAHGFIQ